jgi:PhnB protein
MSSAGATAIIRFEGAVPQFTVPDVVRTAEYYRDVLGFQIAGYWGTPPVFAIVRRDEVELFFNRADAIDFCVSTFDAVELGRRPGPDGTVAHALMTIGPAMIMIEAEWPTLPSRAPTPDGSSPVVIFVYVEDVDRTIERAVGRGAQVLVPAQNQFWGDRIAWIMDPSGHVWTIATRIEETTGGPTS